MGTFIILFIIGTKIAPPPRPNNPENIPPMILSIVPSFSLITEYVIVLFVLSSKYSLSSSDLDFILLSSKF